MLLNRIQAHVRFSATGYATWYRDQMANRYTQAVHVNEGLVNEEAKLNEVTVDDEGYEVYRCDLPLMPVPDDLSGVYGLSAHSGDPNTTGENEIARVDVELDYLTLVNGITLDLGSDTATYFGLWDGNVFLGYKAIDPVSGQLDLAAGYELRRFQSAHARDAWNTLTAESVFHSAYVIGFDDGEGGTTPSWIRRHDCDHLEPDRKGCKVVAVKRIPE